MNVAIIGANGFIGNHLIKFLLENKKLNISLFGKSEENTFYPDLNYSIIDLMNSERIVNQFKDIDLIYYLASASIPASSWGNPMFEIENNLIPFINFLNNISLLNVKKIVFTSSAGTIYGSSDVELNEDSNKKPFSPHGINKISMEYYLNYYEIKHNLKHDIFRVSNIYGEGQNISKGLGIVNTFLEKIITEKEIFVFGNGEIIRNYIYVKDVAKALAFSCDSNMSESSIYNLASDDSLSINEIIAQIKKITKEEFKINYKESRGSDNPKILLDNSKLKNDFNKLQFTPISEGIMSTYLNLKKKFDIIP
jgi:UDP-glucose 4-epimerase